MFQWFRREGIMFKGAVLGSVTCHIAACRCEETSWPDGPSPMFSFRSRLTIGKGIVRPSSGHVHAVEAPPRLAQFGSIDVSFHPAILTMANQSPKAPASQTTIAT